jgi:hypothetical protein
MALCFCREEKNFLVPASQLVTNLVFVAKNSTTYCLISIRTMGQKMWHETYIAKTENFAKVTRE